ncbi:MAG: Calx-beta domain-containing protein [Cyanobacteriota bacterium]|nr:Calx-beta domain-containing protein [Cyanobacteriota bacterium]
MDDLINNDLLSIPSEQIFPDLSLDFFQSGTDQIQSRTTQSIFDGFGDITNIIGGIDIDIGDIDIDIGDINIDIGFGGGDIDPITGGVNQDLGLCEFLGFGCLPEPQISIKDTTITEGNKGQKRARLNVSLDGVSDEVVKVNYTTANGSAKAGSDYKRTNGTLTFQPGERQKAIEIPILGDRKVENNEKFTVKLSDAQNAKIEDNRGIATIKNNDLAKISIRDAQITEGNRGRKQARFTVTMDSEIDKNVKVNYSTVNETAKAGSDYKRTRGTLNFRPGQTKKTISVPILGDTLDENNEKFQVVLSRPKNAKLGDKRAIANIIDNDNSIPEANPDGNFKNATNLGRLNGRIIKTDQIGYIEAGRRDTNDFYRFRLPREGQLRVVLDELFDDANISLYDADKTLISTSRKKGTTPEQILQTLDPGVYYLRVSPFGGALTDYRLQLKSF